VSRLGADRGSVSILVAALTAVLVVLALGAADVARVFAAASRAQTAADAAALAAAQELALPEGIATPAEIAASYAGRNGASLDSCECEPGTFAADVRVAMAAGTLFLAPDDLEVTASARAVVDLPS
jgi:secretion/DNA translocation related TadE-like protein